MISVSIQGSYGSFHHEAVLKFYKNIEVNIIPCSTFRSSVKSVVSKEANHVVMAIENSLAGGILPNYNLINIFNLKIIGEVVLPIKHNLLALHSETIESIKEVRTHPMAFLQCENFLEKHEDWILLEKDDTATCAKNISKNKMQGTAAIASKLAAELYDLKILQENIHDVVNNYTRFYVLSLETEIIPDYNKASLYFSTDHKTGSLSKVLDIFRDYNINITHIQSVPLPGTVFDYSFHVDITFEKQIYYEEAIKKIIKLTGFLKVLGKYKKEENYII